jgi:hypothetical protein
MSVVGLPCHFRVPRDLKAAKRQEDGVKLPKLRQQLVSQRQGVRNSRSVEPPAAEAQGAAPFLSKSPDRATSSPTEQVCAPNSDARVKREATKRPSICTAFSKSSAEALFLIADALGWAVHTQERDDSSLYWVVSEVHTAQRARKLRNGQAISRVPGMHIMAHKCRFSRLMTLGQKLYPGSFDFYPQTWNLPHDMARMQQSLQAQDWKRDAVIVKPSDGSQGDGIFISTSYQDLMVRLNSGRWGDQKGEMVVQKYIASPMLLGGLKFDLRVYVLIRSLDPLEVWVCREGTARMRAHTPIHTCHHYHLAITTGMPLPRARAQALRASAPKLTAARPPRTAATS